MGQIKGKVIKCKDCSQDFIWSVGEQVFFIKNGLSEPKRCPECRVMLRRKQKQLMRKQEVQRGR